MTTALIVSRRRDVRVVTLRDVLASYLMRRLDLAELTRQFYTSYLHTFERWYGGPIPLTALCDELVLRWLADEKRGGLSARTINGRRAMVRVLWKEARRRDWIYTLPGDIPRMKEPRRAATSWTPDEIAKILDCCDAASFEGWPESKKSWSTAHWQALILTIYDTSLRISPFLQLPRSAADTKRRILVSRGESQKNGHDISHVLHQQTCAAIDLLPPHDLLFPWPKHPRLVWPDFRRILQAARLPCTYRDLFHKLRRTSYTQTYKKLGLVGATEHAGHSKDFSAVYLDKTQLDIPPAADVIPRPAFDQLAAADELARRREWTAEVEAKAADEAALYSTPDPSAFVFNLTGFAYRGRTVAMGGIALQIVAAIATSPFRRRTAAELVQSLWPKESGPQLTAALAARLRVYLCYARRRIRRDLKLPADYDALPCVQRRRGGVWGITLPTAEALASIEQGGTT